MREYESNINNRIFMNHIDINVLALKLGKSIRGGNH